MKKNMITQLKQLFGPDRFHHDAAQITVYLSNVCAAKRQIIGIVYPISNEEISKLIILCREFNIPLYPISTGFNYGLGSRLPVQDGHLIVDLSKMNRIISYDAELGIIQIEPGVTQHAIAQYLQENQANFILNVTGSSAFSSIVG